MNIKFTGHQSTERNLELSQKDLFNLFELMRKEFKEHITYARFDRIYSPTKLENMIKDYCQQHGVDIEYTKDRTAFFYSILNNLKNPYQ